MRRQSNAFPLGIFCNRFFRAQLRKLQKIFELLNPSEKRQGYWLILLIIIAALFDLIGIYAIVPFLAILANPELLSADNPLNSLFQWASGFGIDTAQHFLITLGITFFFLLFASLAFRAFTTYAQIRFIQMREYSLGRRLIEGYLHQPYIWFLNRDSIDLGKTILSEVHEVIEKALKPVVIIIAQSTLTCALLFLLLTIDSELALYVFAFLVFAYIISYKIGRKFLVRIGQARVVLNRQRFIAVSEAFASPKEVKVSGLEDMFVRRFIVSADPYARDQVSAQVLSQLPRFVLELGVISGMLLVTGYMLSKSDSFASAIPTIALYAFAGYRLIPALQQIYGAITKLRFTGPALDALHTDLMSLQPTQPDTSQDILKFTQAIKLNQVNFSYPNAPQPALRNLSLTIPAKSTVGLVGATGSGKTTTVDLILGLLEAQNGTLAVDGKAITEHNRRSWQRAIGYVPQQIYLADDTVAANIGFGLDAKDIDQEAVERAAKIANLHDFVANELPHRYQTTVGERGVRLSGGQRQRIGIARALYHNPQVLILDEATSALDNLTEQAVMEAVHNLGHEITIILVAHRLSTVRACDTIFLLENGELIGEGTFQQLVDESETFRAMTDVGQTNALTVK